MRSHVERVWLGLPAAIEFDSHLDASEYHLFSAPEVDAQLNDVAIVNGVRLRFGARRTEPDVVEKGSA